MNLSMRVQCEKRLRCAIRVRKWFGHMDRTDEWRSDDDGEVCGRRLRGRPKYGWMDGVEKALEGKKM